MEDPESFDRSGARFFHGLFIFFHVEENEPKEDARVPLNPARQKYGRRASELASLKQADALFPSVFLMFGAGQRETGKPNVDKLF